MTLINPAYIPAPPQAFGLYAFNNGVINNESLANAGLIRIWIQLDDVFALVSYSGFSVTAVLPDGTCALEFVRVNRPWTNQDYVNSVDVNFFGYWERIYFTATAYGQTVELLLINPV